MGNSFQIKSLACVNSLTILLTGELLRLQEHLDVTSDDVKRKLGDHYGQFIVQGPSKKFGGSFHLYGFMD